MHTINKICPNCEKEIKFEFSFWGVKGGKQPKLKTWKEKWAYYRKTTKLRYRQKRCFLCPHCKEELITFYGKLLKASEANESTIDTVHCDFCNKEINFRKCYKEPSDGSGSGYNFYCKECAIKNLARWLLLILIIIVFVMIMNFTFFRT
jgi:hypothetical protein